MNTHGIHPIITNNAFFLGEFCIFDIQLDQCFGMFRYEGDGNDDQAYFSSPAR